MNPMLLPVAGGLAILLLLVLLVVLRRKARRAAPDEGHDGPEDGALETVGLEDGQLVDGELEDGQVRDGFDDGTDLVPMLAHDDEEPADPRADEHGDDEHGDEHGEPVDPGEQVHTPEPLPSGESVDVRYLRAQVRTLQETLEQVQDTPDPVAARAGEAAFRRQVTAALRGLGERTREDESPERTLARVVAAIERLDAPDEVARPALPTVKFDLSGAQMSLAGPQFVTTPAALGQAPAAPAPAAVPAAAMPSPASDAPAARGAATVTTPLASALAAGVPHEHAFTDHGSNLDPFAQDEQVLTPPPDPDVVRPVPPPASHRQERQRRFGRRRGA